MPAVSSGPGRHPQDRLTSVSYPQARALLQMNEKKTAADALLQMEKRMVVEDLEMTTPARQNGGGALALCRSLSLRAPDPSSQLLSAYRNQDLETFSELLSGSPPEAQPDHWYDDPHFATMLDLASRDDGRAEYARALLDAGADPNRVNKVRKKAPIHLAAEVGNIASLEVLLQAKNIDVNKQDSSGCTALHLAAREDVTQSGRAREELEHRYRRCVQLLMQHPQVSLNKPNRKGLTPVHMAAAHASADMVRIMLTGGGSRLDVDGFEDAQGQTARQVITAKHPHLVRLLPPPADATATAGLTADRLFFYLYSRENANFLDALASMSSAEADAQLLDADDGSHTLMQLASEVSSGCYAWTLRSDLPSSVAHTTSLFQAGLHDVVSALLEAGADPNRTAGAAMSRRSPLHAACHHGYYRVARTLAAHERTDLQARAHGDTPLHAAVKGAAECGGLALAASRAGRDHRKCVQVLLARGVDVNAADVKGNTALHYAARNGDADVVAALLRAGAYIGVRNCFGEPPLADVAPRALEAYLDECVVTNDLLPREDNYEVIFKYNFLAGAHRVRAAPPRAGHGQDVSVGVEEDAKRLMGEGQATEAHACETDPLLYMSRSADLRYLLKHPIITSFLYLKWQRIRGFFFVNLAFYVAFWLLLTAYVLTGYSEQPEQGLISEALGGEAAPTTDKQNASAKGDGPGDLPVPNVSAASAAPLVAGLLAFFLLLLALRELFQLVVSPHKYVLNPENWLEAMLIVNTAVLLLSRQTNSYSRQQLSAVAILLSWAELVLLIGRHPLLATNIEMFKTVSLNFLKFLAWYSILIVAFALSFYTLFRDCGGGGVSACKDGDDENFFLSPAMSVFKSIVMLTGEFDAGSIPFVTFPVTSHILFVLFVFLIAIVLFNLLNGLAVSDTQAIREDAELVAYVSRVKLVAYVESMLVGAGPQRGVAGWLSGRMRSALCGCLNTCKTVCIARVNLFPEVVPDQQIHVLPNQGNRIEFATRGSCSRNRAMSLDDDELAGCAVHCTHMSMDPAIMRDVKELFIRRAEQTEVGNMQKRIDHYEREVQNYVERIRHLENSQKELLEILRSNRQGSPS
ncbi:Transient receptor potential cation channel protein painless [Frankliniella fusca]|uniref:Transient receptor potential cation channel protein painless n=1 Tax=Frankliniella fusca TaxID=407009 RepID=A0AAE1I4I1_9NEOP|nr:Transient receptor potential cation channel protein painless [Frankliniella fusca]